MEIEKEITVCSVCPVCGHEFEHDVMVSVAIEHDDCQDTN